MNELSLEGKKILVTGVSRPRGIGAAIVKRLTAAQASVICHGNSAYDADLAYMDASEKYAGELAKELREEGSRITVLSSSDLSIEGEPERIMEEAIRVYGYVDGLVLNHAYSTSCPIGEWTKKHIDAHLNTNVTASMLLIQAFAKQLPKEKSGAVTLFTSGQYLGPMNGEIAYAVSKDAIIGLCRQTAVALAKQKIRVNCINPGATDTGYVQPGSDGYQMVASMFPGGRWGMPEDAAKLVQFLQSDYSSWITGQIIASEGGFDRYREC